MNRRSFLAALAASSVMVKRALGMETAQPLTITSGVEALRYPLSSSGVSKVVLTPAPYSSVIVDEYGLSTGTRFFHTNLYTSEGKVVSEPAMKQFTSNCVRSISGKIGDGANNVIDIVHNLGTRDVIVKVREAGEFSHQVATQVQVQGRYSVRLTFNYAPRVDEYFVVVMGAPDPIYVDDPRYHMVTEEHADSGAAVRKILKLSMEGPSLYAVDVWVNPSDRQEWKRRIDAGLIQFL